MLYVARQLGHSSVTLTVDTYGHLLGAGEKLDLGATLGKLLDAYEGATTERSPQRGKSVKPGSRYWSRRRDSNP